MCLYFPLYSNAWYASTHSARARVSRLPILSVIDQAFHRTLRCKFGAPADMVIVRMRNQHKSIFLDARIRGGSRNPSASAQGGPASPEKSAANFPSRRKNASPATPPRATNNGQSVCGRRESHPPRQNNPTPTQSRAIVPASTILAKLTSRAGFHRANSLFFLLGIRFCRRASTSARIAPGRYSPSTSNVGPFT